MKKFTSYYYANLMFIGSISIYLLLLLEYLLDKSFLAFSIPAMVWLIGDYIEYRKAYNNEKKSPD